MRNPRQISVRHDARAAGTCARPWRRPLPTFPATAGPHQLAQYADGAFSLRRFIGKVAAMMEYGELFSTLGNRGDTVHQHAGFPFPRPPAPACCCVARRTFALLFVVGCRAGKKSVAPPRKHES